MRCGPGSWRRARASRRAICRSTRTICEIADFRDREVEGDLDVGRNLGNWGEIRVGCTASTAWTYDRWGNPDLVDAAVQQRRVLLQVLLRPARQRAFPARRSDVHAAMGCQSHQFGRGLLLGSRDAPTGWWRAPAAATRCSCGYLGRHDPGRRRQADRRAGLLFVGRLFQSLGTRAVVLARSELCDRARHLLSQDQPRRGGFLRVSGLRRHVIGGRAIPGRVAATSAAASAHKDGSLFLAFDTFLGPVYLGSGYDGQTGNAGYYLFLGRTF